MHGFRSPNRAFGEGQTRAREQCCFHTGSRAQIAAEKARKAEEAAQREAAERERREAEEAEDRSAARARAAELRESVAYHRQGALFPQLDVGSARYVETWHPMGQCVRW